MTSFVTISDVHIKKNCGSAHDLFLQFLNHEKTKQADKIYLLGDIFDLLVGSHVEYTNQCPLIFNAIKYLLKNDKKIIQIEGNHDFHFEELVIYLCNSWKIDPDRWLYCDDLFVEEIDGKRILFAHGDEIEVGNVSYKVYRKLIRSRFIKFLADEVVPFSWVDAIGNQASEKSRQRNVDKYQVQERSDEIKKRFRKSVHLAAKKHNVDFVFCGHSHCFEYLENRKINYYNNGYFPSNKKFFHWENKKVEVISL